MTRGNPSRPSPHHGQHLAPSDVVQLVLVNLHDNPVVDPACGSGGFLTAAHDVLRDRFNQRLAAWRDHMRDVQHYSKNTIRDRAGAVSQIVTLYDVPGGELAEGHVRAFLDDHVFQPWTVRTYLRHFSKWSQYLDIDDPTASIEIPDRPTYELNPVPDEDIADLIAHASPRMGAWIRLGAHCGLTSSEAAKIEGRQFDLDEACSACPNYVTLPGPGEQTTQIPVPVETAEELRPTIAAHTPGRLWDVSPLHLSSSFHEYALSRGYDYGYGQLRQSFGWDVYDRTRDLIKTQYMMRHANSKTTAAFVAGAHTTAEREVLV